MTPNHSLSDKSAIRPDLPSFDLDLDVVRALYWCRLGRVRPQDDSAFHRAKQLGLLAQDSVWRATPQGEGVLIALGLLDGVPSPPRTCVVALWATCPRFPTGQYVTAWSEGLDDMMPEEAERQREEAERWFRDFGDESGWRFFTTREYLERPGVPDAS